MDLQCTHLAVLGKKTVLVHCCKRLLTACSV